MNALLLLSFVASTQPALTADQLDALEAACSGWSGEIAYQQAHESGACMSYFGEEPGERSAFDAPPEYRQLKRGGE